MPGESRMAAGAEERVGSLLARGQQALLAGDPDPEDIAALGEATAVFARLGSL